MNHPSDETLNDYIERELNPADHVHVAAHLETCATCALVIEEIHRVLRQASALGPIAPPPHVWARIQTRIAAGVEGVGGVGRVEGVGGVGRVESLQSKAQSPESKAPSPEPTAQSPEPTAQSPEPEVHSLQPTVHSPLRRIQGGRLAWALATAALVVMAFLAGRFINLREQSDAVQQAAAAGSGQPVRDEATVRERVLLIAVGDHLERSQMVLVELAHAETRGSLDISAQRQLADDLVASNRLYRQTALQTGQANVAGLLDELERVLVEVARGPSTVNMQQLAIIQQQIEAQGILFKMKVIGSGIRHPPVYRESQW